MRWFLSMTLLMLLALTAACSSQPTATTAAPPANAQSVTVYKSPT
jgi:curli biogenesis system outer membrane secretion channel CsgG